MSPRDRAVSPITRTRARTHTRGGPDTPDRHRVRESTAALDISAEAVNASVYPCPDLTCQATKAISDTSPLRSSARFTGRVG